MRALRHVTLSTGHVRDSLPDEVAPEALAHCHEIIVRMTAGETSEAVPIGIPGYSIVGRASGKCLVATVYRDGPPSVQVVTIGVAAHSMCGARLWRELHRWGNTPVATDPERCPAEPWVAAAIDAPDMVAMQWLGDFERCLAWAWLEEKR